MPIKTDLNIQEIQIKDLKPAPYNPRDINDEALDGLESSLTRFGIVEPIIWNQKTGFIVGGHQRLKVLQKQGIKSTSVVVVDLDETEEKALNVTLNNRSIQGDWTTELADIIEELKGSLSNSELLDLHIDKLEAEIPDFEIENLEPERDPDAVPETPEEPISKPGQIYALGPHRLMCGDATNPAHYSLLFGEKKADLIFSDPPYNVAYTGSSGLTIKNDNLTEEEFIKFLNSSFKNMVAYLKPGSGVYIAHSDTGGTLFRNAFVEAGLELKQCLIWVKNQFVIGRQDYQWRHEPILYGWKAGEAHRWYGERKQSTVIEDKELLHVSKEKDGFQLHINDGIEGHTLKVPKYEIIDSTSEEFTTVWRFAKPLKNTDHPTMKPVSLIQRAIRNSSKIGDIVLDPFLGSGSTLIASEQLKRICYGFELDPKYCDVIIKRWEQFTGLKAEVIN